MQFFSCPKIGHLPTLMRMFSYLNRLPAALLASLLVPAGYVAGATSPATVEQWGVFEVSLTGPREGNPFVEVQLSADFQQGGRKIAVTGFYDGEGVYRLRFMPEAVGDWNYYTHSNRSELDGKAGVFTVTAPTEGNHGPVRVADRYHFRYADSSPYWELGTTCYAWVHQMEPLQEQTLQTLAAAPFNKLRMCVFPKWMIHNRTEPPLYPFEGTAPNQWDFTRLNPAFFQHLEQRIAALGKLGIEADVILFHPYDEGHWGFDRMGAANDDRYLRYVIARLSSYRNVWWALANEWDVVKGKQVADWERLGGIVHADDPYGHLCSIHQQRQLFDRTRPWISHISLQLDHTDEAGKYLNQYKKPLIYDECRYEGDIAEVWGDITAVRLVSMFWKALVGGAYCGHGETYTDPNDVLWWSKGGVLHGQSPARLAFFKQVVSTAPPAAAPLKQNGAWGVEGEYYLIYLWDRQHAQQPVDLPGKILFHAEVIDTWDMTITPVPGTFSGHALIPLPTKPYLAVRLTPALAPSKAER